MKEKKIKKILSIVLLFAMFTSLFVGCSKEETISTNDGGTNQNNNNNLNNESQEDEIIELTMMTWQTDAETYEEFNEQFEAENPNIKINVITTTDGDYNDKLTVSLAAGEKVDIFTHKNAYNYSDLSYKDQTLDLTEFIEKDNFDLEPFGNFLNSLKIDNKLYGLPYRNSVWVLYYNKDLFDEAEIDYPSDDMTWDEFCDLAKEMTFGENKGAFIQSFTASIMMPLIQRGDTILDDDLTSLEESLKLLDRLYKDGSAQDWGTNKTTSANYKAAFESGKVAMLPVGEWLISVLNTHEAEGAHNVNWDIAALPHPEGVEPNTSFGSPSVLSIHKNSKYAEAAWKYVKARAGYEGAKYTASKGINPGYMNNEIREIFMNAEGMPEHASVISDANLMPEQIVGPNVKAISNIFKEEAELYLIGETTMEETIKNIKERRAELLGN